MSALQSSVYERKHNGNENNSLFKEIQGIYWKIICRIKIERERRKLVDQLIVIVMAPFVTIRYLRKNHYWFYYFGLN